MECWATLHLGYPTVMHVAQECAIFSSGFRENAAAYGILLQFSAIKGQNSLGTGE